MSATERGSARKRIQKVRKEFGAKIRELRREQDWSLEVFAKICRLNPNQLGRIERGEADVIMETLDVIAKKLGTTVKDILVSLG